MTCSTERTVYKLNPLTDKRWPEFLARHPESSIFHTPEWLEALHRTYGYEPVAFTTSNATELSNALVFCVIQSWLTGKRLVSLPFSDHCQPLAAGGDLEIILDSLHQARRNEHWDYIELRPVLDNGMVEGQCHFTCSNTFSIHEIDLRPPLDAIYSRFHDSCVRRKIKRAEREKLVYEVGRSEQLLEKFLHLLLLTRRRHGLPPQPALWFRNLVHCLGDNLTIHVLSKDADPVASIVTLTHKDSLIYKYGCSDARFHSLGSVPLLFWEAIQRGKRMGANQIDLGRSGPEDSGLIAFKGHFGGIASRLNYYRDPALRVRREFMPQRLSWARQALAYLPGPMLTGAGRLLYRHLG